MPNARTKSGVRHLFYMDWIVQLLVKLLLKCTIIIFNLLVRSIYNSIGINIGAKFSTITISGSAKNTGAVNTVSFEETMNSVLSKSQYTAAGDKGELWSNASGHTFDVLFSGVANFQTILIYTGLCLVCIIAFIEIYKSFLGPLEEAENPISVLGRSVIAALGVTFSYDILVMIEYVFNSIYIEFLNSSKNIVKSSGDLFFGSMKIGEDTVNKEIKGPELAGDPLVIGTGVVKIAMGVLVLILFGLLLLEFVKFVAEVIERYVLLGVLFYLSPLAFSTYASKNTSQFFKAFMQMMFGQCLSLILSIFFFDVFYDAINIHMGPMGVTQLLIYVFMLVAWLKIAQNTDKYMSAMGLSIAQCGSSMLVAGQALTTSIGNAKNAGRHAMNEREKKKSGADAAANGGGGFTLAGANSDDDPQAQTNNKKKPNGNNSGTNGQAGTAGSPGTPPKSGGGGSAGAIAPEPVYRGADAIDNIATDRGLGRPLTGYEKAQVISMMDNEKTFYDGNNGHWKITGNDGSVVEGVGPGFSPSDQTAARPAGNAGANNAGGGLDGAPNGFASGFEGGTGTGTGQAIQINDILNGATNPGYKNFQGLKANFGIDVSKDQN